MRRVWWPGGRGGVSARSGARGADSQRPDWVLYIAGLVRGSGLGLTARLLDLDPGGLVARLVGRDPVLEPGWDGRSLRGGGAGGSVCT